MILNFSNFLNQVLFYLLFYINEIELNTVERIYTQFNFTWARYLIKRFITGLVKQTYFLRTLCLKFMKIYN